MDRLYCTLAELIDDLELMGVKSEAKALGFIRAASQWIDKRGWFIPTTASRSFDGSGCVRQWIDPLLSVTSLTVNSTALTASEYVLYPRTKHWENGPYTSLEKETGGAWTDEENAFVIVGKWGMYDSTRSLTATVANQTDTATTIVVSSGAEFSPGCVLLIGSEQELITATGEATDSTANLAEDLDATEEAIDVSSGSVINVGEVVRVDFEQMYVLSKQTNTLLVVRGWNGTAKTTHANAADVYVYRTFAVKRGINGTTAAAHLTAAIARYVPPDDVNYLCRQIAGLMLKKAQSGFAGKVGNAELGEVFYFNEFPNDPIKKVMENYRIVTI